jgi:hypothetical protein
MAGCRAWIAANVAKLPEIGRLFGSASVNCHRRAHTSTDVAISTSSGLSGDFADLAIAISRHARVGNLERAYAHL